MKYPRMLAFCCALAATPAAGQVTIGPDPDLLWWTEHFRVGQHGSSWEVVGQTFTVPTHASVITDFRFLVVSSPWPPAPSLRMNLMAWDQASYAPVGDVLFRSDLRTGEGPPGAHHFAIDRLWLQPGAMYVAFLSPLDDPQPEPADRYSGFSTVGGLRDHPFNEGVPIYGGGDMVHLGSSGGGWKPYRFDDERFDAHFSATFDATTAPEPASMALLGTGLAGLAGAARRRRRRRDEQAAADSGS